MTEERKEIINVMKEMFTALNEKMDAKFDSIDAKFESMDAKFDDLQSQVKEIKLTLENETNRNIRLLAEGLTPLPDKVNRLSDDMEVVKFDVDIVKKVVTTHSSQIDKLRQAK